MRTPVLAVALLAIAVFIGGYAVGQLRGVSGTFAAVSTPTPTTIQGSPSFPAHGSAAHEDAEKAVTGSAASQAKSAAVKYVGSGTVGAVTTDFQGSGYEVTVTKADGSAVEVHLDSSFNVMDGPGGHGFGFGPPPSGTSGGPSA